MSPEEKFINERLSTIFIYLQHAHRQREKPRDLFIQLHLVATVIGKISFFLEGFKHYDHGLEKTELLLPILTESMHPDNPLKPVQEEVKVILVEFEKEFYPENFALKRPLDMETLRYLHEGLMLLVTSLNNAIIDMGTELSPLRSHHINTRVFNHRVSEWKKTKPSTLMSLEDT